MFENRVLRSIFGPKSDEVTGEWRKLHNEEPKFYVHFIWSISKVPVKPFITSSICSPPIYHIC
jgi:hypothetical protein